VTYRANNQLFAAHRSAAEQSMRSARLPIRGFLFAALWGFPMGLWLLLFFVVPLLLLFLISFWSVENFQLSAVYNLKNWQDVLTTPYFRVGYYRTFFYACSATILSVLLAFPLSYTLSFKLSPSARRLCLLLLITPFFTSYLTKTYSWQVILADNGLINSALVLLGLQPVHILNTPVATIIGYLTYLLPLVSLFLLASLDNIDRTLIEAAHNLGVGRLGCIFRVVVPSSRVGIVIAATFSFIISFGDFVAPSILGGGNPPTLSILIIDTVKSASDWPGAAAVAGVMIFTLLAVSLLSFRVAFKRRA
jgi:ABC-type spermidine/putrescine transport system permease subunit I